MSAPHRFEAEASDKLLAACDAEAVESAGSGVNAACIALQFGEPDLVVRMQDAARLILAAEALADAAGALAKGARAVLAEVMTEVGCPALALQSHTVSASHGRPRLNVPDESAVPRRFWVQPPERIDAKALLKAHQDGDAEARACASLANSAPFITFHKRDEPRKETV